MKIPLWFLFTVIPLLSAGAQAGTETVSPVIIAHRGASKEAPENTVAAAKLGFEKGADAVEVDVWLSKDGHPVVIHDSTTKRTTGVDKKVKDMELSELQALDAGSWFDEKFANERIPTLDQILEARSSEGVIVIEIKDKDPALIPAIAVSLERTASTPDQTALIAFDFDTLKAAKERLPDYRAYWLHGYKKKAGTDGNPAIDELITKTKDAGFEGLNLHYDWPIDEAFVEKIHEAALELYIWTVNNRLEIRNLMEAGVDGITTDRPDVAVIVETEMNAQAEIQREKEASAASGETTIPPRYRRLAALITWLLFAVVLQLLFWFFWRHSYDIEIWRVTLTSTLLMALYFAISIYIADSPPMMVLAYVLCAAVSWPALGYIYQFEPKTRTIVCLLAPIILLLCSMAANSAISSFSQNLTEDLLR